MSRPGSLYTLQAGRGIAAMLVVLFHATGMFASNSYWNATILGGFFGFGHAGVEFFFSLSGFIMVLVHRRDLGRPAKLKGFIFKRFVRVYPVYWLVTVAVFLLYLVSKNDRSSLMLNSLLLIGVKNDGVLAVSWTLFHEVLFYAIFSISIINRKLGISCFVLWFFSCAYWIGSPAPWYVISSMNIIFAFGMFAAIKYRALPKPLIIMTAAAAIFVIIGMEEVFLQRMNEEVRTLMYGFASSIGIAAAASAEVEGSITVRRWITELGDSSYSIYLIHYPFLAITSQLWLSTPLRRVPALLAFLILFILTIIVGLTFHRLIEKPLIKVLASKKTTIIKAIST